MLKFLMTNLMHTISSSKHDVKCVLLLFQCEPLEDVIPGCFGQVKNKMQHIVVALNSTPKYVEIYGDPLI